MIKDSGDRTKFGTGAVRDMHAGKGRMDLLPLSALIELSKHCEEVLFGKLDDAFNFTLNEAVST